MSSLLSFVAVLKCRDLLLEYRFGITGNSRVRTHGPCTTNLGYNGVEGWWDSNTYVERNLNLTTRFFSYPCPELVILVFDHPSGRAPLLEMNDTFSRKRNSSTPKNISHNQNATPNRTALETRQDHNTTLYNTHQTTPQYTTPRPGTTQNWSVLKSILFQRILNFEAPYVLDIFHFLVSEVKIWKSFKSRVLSQSLVY